MSMLSAMRDELRERAKELRGLAPDPAVPYLVPSTKETMALAMRSAASEMEDAANTIWELRCKLVDIVADLQEALAENAKLRGFWTHDGAWHVELPKLPKGIAVTTTDERDREVRTARVWRYVREDEAENDRLRELVRYADECAIHSDHATCDDCRRMNSSCILADRMRELGIEVDA